MFNSFLFKIINDYISIDDIIKLCKINGVLSIKNGVLNGECFYKEEKKQVKIIYSDKKISGYILSSCMSENTKKEIFESYIKEKKYISKYSMNYTVENSETNYFVQKIDKSTIYDWNKDFLARTEDTKNICKIKRNGILFDIETLCYEEKENYIKVDEKTVLRKHTKISEKGSKEITDYSISTDYRNGVFSSGDSSNLEYYLGFSQIDSTKYNKMLKKIYKDVY